MKPIILNTHEIRALLDNGTVQIRRLIKRQLTGYDDLMRFASNEVSFDELMERFTSKNIPFKKLMDMWNMKPPYYPDDAVYVRETWAPSESVDSILYSEDPYVYKADCAIVPRWKWQSPATMPRDAARLFGAVKAVRVERLQDMTISDIASSGIKIPSDYEPELSEEEYLWFEYHRMWESGLEATERNKYGWNANPWVRVYEVERAEPPKEDVQ